MVTQAATARSTVTLLILFDLHSKLFMNVLDDISDKDAHNRFNTRANHMAWLAGSLVHERYELANASGMQVKESFHDLYDDHKGIQDCINYPPVATFEKEWKQITPMLRDALMNLNEDQLESPDPYGMPGYHLTFFDAITFIMDRESYCIGQLGLWRRLMGYEAMKYQ